MKPLSLKTLSYWISTILLTAALLAGCGGSSVTSGAEGGVTPPVNTPAGAEASQAPEQPAEPISSATVPPASPTAEAAPTEPPASAPTEAEPADSGSAASLPDPAGYEWVEFATGLQEPVGIESSGDGSGRLFVIEQPGRIRVLEGNQVSPDPFLDITDRVGAGGSEQGLLGLAFHPRYAENGYFYVNYTDQNGDTVISRFQTTSDPNTADPGSETVLMRVDQPYANHNGGSVEFGPDGILYLGLGDGGAGGDPEGNGQSTETLLGKILRIDVDSSEPYAIPADNPFGAGGGRGEIWAYGLRNPWRIAFDRATGDLYIADVGQNVWEEINFQPADAAGGENYGWDLREGAHPFEQDTEDITGLVEPVAEYQHSEGGCSVTGGEVYRGPALADWQGVYLYGDYCTGNVWGLLKTGDTWTSALLFQTPYQISTFGLDEAGEIYLAHHSGTIYRLEQSSP